MYSSAGAGFLNVVLLSLCRQRAKGYVLAIHLWDTFHFQDATFCHSCITYSKFYQEYQPLGSLPVKLSRCRSDVDKVSESMLVSYKMLFADAL